jgi:hypothetical protein
MSLGSAQLVLRQVFDLKPVLVAGSFDFQNDDEYILDDRAVLCILSPRHHCAPSDHFNPAASLACKQIHRPILQQPASVEASLSASILLCKSSSSLSWCSFQNARL